MRVSPRQNWVMFCAILSLDHHFESCSENIICVSEVLKRLFELAVNNVTFALHEKFGILSPKLARNRVCFWWSE